MATIDFGTDTVPQWGRRVADEVDGLFPQRTDYHWLEQLDQLDILVCNDRGRELRASSEQVEAVRDALDDGYTVRREGEAWGGERIEVRKP